MLVASVLVVILGTAAIATAWDASTDPVNKFLGYNYFTKAAYPDANRVIEKNLSFNFEQSVQGNGYYMTYKYAKMGNVELKDYAHGSGSLDNSAILASYDAIKKTHLWNADWNDYNVSCIQYKETTHATYAPTKIAVGTGYYAANPLNYDSLIKEKTWLKNRASGTSMQNEVEYAHKLDKDLSAVVKDYTNFTYDPLYKSNAFSQMKVTEDVGEGKIHIGVLQANSDFGGVYGANSLNSAWKGGVHAAKPAIEIDEDYFGTYHVEKNMTISVPYSRNAPSYDWLPCTCNAGWDDMIIHDQRYHSAKGFFDCTTCMPPAPCKN